MKYLETTYIYRVTTCLDCMMEELSLRLKEECGVDVDGGEADWAEEASEDADEEEVRAAVPEPM